MTEMRVGLAHIHIHHTCASLCLNENADPDVRRDFESFFNHAVPEMNRITDMSMKAATICRLIWSPVCSVAVLRSPLPREGWIWEPGKAFIFASTAITGVVEGWWLQYSANNWRLKEPFVPMFWPLLTAILLPPAFLRIGFCWYSQQCRRHTWIFSLLRHRRKLRRKFLRRQIIIAPYP